MAAGRYLLNAGLASVLAFAAGKALAAEIKFSDVVQNIADNTIVIEVDADDVLVFDGGNVDLGGKNLLINAPRLKAIDITVVRSFDPEVRPPTVEGEAAQGQAGANGGSWGCTTLKIGGLFGTITVCSRDGQIGQTGNTGEGGRQGAPSGKIVITAAAIEGDGKLVVIGNGQSGGKGQQGGKGGDGGRGANGTNRGGDVFCNGSQTPLNGGAGGRGGPGGIGGTGGIGGAGAEIVLSSALQEATRTYDTIDLGWLSSMEAAEAEKLASVRLMVAAPGGLFGIGGEPGTPGDGKAGGDPGKGGHCGGGSDPGAPGRPGDPGQKGSDGSLGPAGSIRFE
ncbi:MULTISPECIES: hypothetical protein [unclassified Mesorhizobium]|uniref:hypothetical protein n=1 Tax=unclassified Mesorhizobium TaxID=325217 RepID=UPI001093D86C|nr:MULTISPECIES: hypothetical protein [unclassified Mesorhizobium]TGT93876.1 hypothetical protein EN807_26880 [Mesorhizobium sp. M5C.F.Ca.ET.164.01.1.1]